MISNLFKGGFPAVLTLSLSFCGGPIPADVKTHSLPQLDDGIFVEITDETAQAIASEQAESISQN